VLLWSFFTAATGRAWNLASLMVTQFLFGAGEAGAFPNLAKTYTHWLPARERSRAVSTMWLCSRWGGAVTPLLVVGVIALVGWRWLSRCSPFLASSGRPSSIGGSATIRAITRE